MSCLRSALIGGSLLATAPLAAQPSPSVAFGYDVPKACPLRADFSAQVDARTRSWLVPPASMTVTVEIVTEDAGLVGRVRLERQGRTTLRELRAERCDELVRALALIVAILIDPQADVAPTPTPRRAAPANPPPRAPEPKPVAASSARALRFVVGPELVARMGVSPGVALGERAFLGVELGEGTSWLSSARLALARTRGDGVSGESGARADFELDSARLEGGVLRLASGPFALEPVALVEAGSVRAEGQHPTGDVLRRKAWVALGAGVRPSVTLARRLTLALGLFVDFPLARYRFAFTGEDRLYQTEIAGLEAAASLGLRFP